MNNNRFTAFVPKPAPLIPARNKAECALVTRYKNGKGPLPPFPDHGTSGWYNGEAVVWGFYDHAFAGWYTVPNYQKLRVLKEGIPDFRVLPAGFYSAGWNDVPQEENRRESEPARRFASFSPGPRRRTTYSSFLSNFL